MIWASFALIQLTDLTKQFVIHTDCFLEGLEEKKKKTLISAYYALSVLYLLSWLNLNSKPQVRYWNPNFSNRETDAWRG